MHGSLQGRPSGEQLELKLKQHPEKNGGSTAVPAQQESSEPHTCCTLQHSSCTSHSHVLLRLRAALPRSVARCWRVVTRRSAPLLRCIHAPRPSLRVGASCMASKVRRNGTRAVGSLSFQHSASCEKRYRAGRAAKTTNPATRHPPMPATCRRHTNVRSACGIYVPDRAVLRLCK